MDEPSEQQLYGWLCSCGYSDEEASKIIEEVDAKGEAEITLPCASQYRESQRMDHEGVLRRLGPIGVDLFALNDLSLRFFIARPSNE